MQILPIHTPPDFTHPDLTTAPIVRTESAPADGVAPSLFHATSNHPEYIHLGNGQWLLARESRMDAVMVLRGHTLEIIEPRLLKKGDPVVVGSIRDDGPLPGVINDARLAQDAMRVYARRATTVIGLATQLHSIAFGNMLPGYQVLDDGSLRPVFFYVVDMTEFSVDKLANRGSVQAIPILTNAQVFMVNLRHNLC